MNEEKKLLPCPFCGNKEVHITSGEHIKCLNCDVLMYAESYQSISIAINNKIISFNDYSDKEYFNKLDKLIEGELIKRWNKRAF